MAGAQTKGTEAKKDTQTTDVNTSNVGEADQIENAAEVPFDPKLVELWRRESLEFGDTARGALVFANAKYACLSCHRVGKLGGTVGPDFNQLNKQKRTDAELIESIFWPNRKVDAEFISYSIIDIDGKTHSGYVVSDEADAVTLREPATGIETKIAKSDIDETINNGTMMPNQLAHTLTKEEQLDLIRFILSLANDPELDIDQIEVLMDHAQSHQPLAFEFDNAPLDPDQWTHADHHINRDRIYDFYAKQAEFFRTDPHAKLLTEFPGLDGGTDGHWGNQNEDVWKDGRWNEAELGSVQAGVFRGANVTVARAICLQLGDNNELSVCFNSDTLTYDALWKGGFVQFSPVRHGFVGGLLIDGQPLTLPEQQQPTEPTKLHGFYRHGKRVLFAYRIGDKEFLDAPWVKDGKFERLVAERDRHPLQHLIQGGDSQWPDSIETIISLGNQRPYAIDTIALPYENPWQAPLFISGHDFDSDGSAFVATMQGDLWHVDQFALPNRTQKKDSNSAKSNQPNQFPSVARWRRFASGLHHPLGVIVDDDVIFVQCRDQLMRLHDLNDDGEADFYECFSNAFQTSSAGHDFICGLQRDVKGRFYTASGNQGIVRISADGTRAETIATGFRNPDGIGLTPDGIVTVPCSEGGWTPASMICAVDAQDSNAETPHFGYRGPKGDSPPALPLVYLPRGIDNSSGGQVFIDSDRWGPYQGSSVHLSFGAGTHFILLRDQVDGQWQGGIVPLGGDFLSGVHRGRFHPIDGQLYVSGMAGWGSYTPDDGCFQRVRYSGAPVQSIIGFHVHQNGVRVRLAEAPSKTLLLDSKNHFAQCWNYRYSSGYGSPEFSTIHKSTPGHDVLRIAGVYSTDDPQEFFIEIPQIQPVNQLHLRLKIDAAAARDIFLTVHRLDQPYTNFAEYREVPKTIAPHPILADMALAKNRIKNPWRKKIEGAREIKIATAENLSFATREINAKSGEPIMFTLVNPDVVPHNWALIQPGSLQRFGAAANRLIASPEAVARQYVPDSKDLICYTDIVDPKSESTIFFYAPEKPGRYPFVCTFPGHWMVMNGVLTVE